MVALVASPGGLGGLWNRRPLLGGRRLTSLEEHLLLVDSVGNLRRLAGEVEVLAHILLGGRARAKGIIVEGVVRLI